MRTEARIKHANLHYHDGSTCHGRPTLEACAEDAMRHCWVGRILEKTDTTTDGKEVRCYSLISGNFDHWGKHGKFVAAVEMSWRRL